VVKERRDVTVLHVDVDAEQRLAERFAVRTVPMMFVFRGGRPVRATGGQRLTHVAGEGAALMTGP
jgi:thioredoxin-like negative regulator of GroEL